MISRKNLDWACERGILFLFLGMLVFAPLAFGAVDEWAFLVVEGIGIGVFILWGLRLWLDPKPKLLWPPLTWVVVAFTIYAVVRYFTADIEYVARVEVIQVLLFAFVFFVVINNLHSQDEAQTISFTLIALATLISCYAVAQLLTHSDRVWNLHSNNVGRAGGTYILPNDLAGLLGMLLPLAMSYLLVGRVHIVTRILLIYAVAAMIPGLGVTFSRAGWVATGVGIFFVLSILLCHRNHRLRAILFLALLLIGGGLFVTKYLSKTTGYMLRVENPDKNGPGVVDFKTRFEIWSAANQMWQDNFWYGVGPAHFDYRFRAYRPEAIQLRPDRAHNDYLNLLADWGLIGGIIVFIGIGLFAFALIKTWPHVRRAEDDFGRGQSNRFAFFLGATGGLLALAVHSTMDFNLHIPANALVGVTLLALLASNLRFATAQYWLRAGTPVKLILTGAIMATIGVFIADESRRSGEAFWLANAARQQIFSQGKVAALEKAFAYEPQNFQTADSIGECLQQQSMNGGDDFATLAQQAMDWYARAIHLDPYDQTGFLGMGICLDLIGKHDSAEKYFSEAEIRDPKGYFTLAYIGWHFVQTGDYAAARQYFIRSSKLSNLSDFGRNYLNICETKLAEKASGHLSSPFDY